MKRNKMHWVRSYGNERAVCGRRWMYPQQIRVTKVTTYTDRVTCLRCLAIISAMQERSVPHGR